MSRPVLADTGPLYALADPSDQFHSHSREQADRLHAEGYHVAVAWPTVCEAYTLVLRRLGRAYARKWLRELLDGVVTLNPEPADYGAALRWLAAHPDFGVTLFDAVAAALAARLSIPVWAYDHHFQALGARRWE